jgi:hypothetical protein
VERGESAQRARMDSVTPDDKLEGFLWKSEDWHDHIITLQVSSFIILSSRCMEEIEKCFMYIMCLTSHVITNTPPRSRSIIIPETVFGTYFCKC